MRLLFCQKCRTLEELPDFTPTHKGHVDPLLEELVRRHNVKDPMAHGGAETLPLSVMVVSEKDWAENRKEIIKGINDQHKKISGVTDADYVLESLDTFKYDAMTCYQRHHRPEDGCIDWRDDSKRIGRPTPEGQRAMKDLPKTGDPFLCDFCVVKTGVDFKKRAAKGMYKG